MSWASGVVRIAGIGGVVWARKGAATPQSRSASTAARGGVFRVMGSRCRVRKCVASFLTQSVARSSGFRLAQIVQQARPAGVHAAVGIEQRGQLVREGL